MTRALAFLVRNWPLKLAAIGLAAVLYAGVVLPGSARLWPGEVSIAVVDPPAGGVLLEPLGSVGDIRYRAPLDLAGQLTTRSFRASVDLSGLEPQAGGPAVTVPIQLVALDPRVTVIDFAPRSADVRLDRLGSRVMPVTVDRGAPPEGLVLGPPQVEPATVLLRGASSRLTAVQGVVGRVAVDASARNIDQEPDLEPVDEAGERVPGVEVVPSRARIRIGVARQFAYAVLPVVVDLDGEPARGHRVTAVRVDPMTVTVSGEAPVVERLASIATAPVPVDGLTAGQTLRVALAPPPAVSLIGSPEVVVELVIAPDGGSRTVEAGVVVKGVRRDRHTELSSGSVLVTLAGDVGRLDALAPGDFVAVADITGMGVGRHEVEVDVVPPEGLRVTGVTPRVLVVRVAPAPEASPAAVGPSVSPSAVAALERATPATPTERPGGP